MDKNLLIEITMGKSPNEMGNCQFASPLVAPLLVPFSSLMIERQSMESEYSDSVDDVGVQ